MENVPMELFEKFMDNHDRQIDLLVKVIERQSTRISNLEQKLGQNSELERELLQRQINKMEVERLTAVRLGDSPPLPGDNWHPPKMSSLF